MDTPAETGSKIVIEFQDQIEVFANNSGGITIQATHGHGEVSTIAFRRADADLIVRAIRNAKKELSP